MKIRHLSISVPFLLPLAISCSESTGPGDSGGTAAAPATGGTVASSGWTGGMPGAGGAGGSLGVGGTGNASTTGGSENGGNTGGGLSSGGSSSDGASATGGRSSGGASNAGGSSVGGTGTGGSASGGTGAETGGTVNVPDPPPLQNPQDGHATHYWDCCKPSCAWPAQGSAKSCTRDNQLQSNPDDESGCFGGNSYQCWSMAPWEVSDTLAYGFAAFNAGACGSCYQLEFTGASSSTGNNDPGSAAIADKIMIVQTLNRGGIGQGQFDLLVPGGGVGFDACSTQWNASGSLGERYGGFFLECRNQSGGNHEAAKQCARSKCESLFTQTGEEDLLARREE